MNTRIAGQIVTALIIGIMIVLTIKSAVEKANSSDPLGSQLGLEEGEMPPDFELTTLAGDVVKLSDYKGKKVILNFWATWCPPCREEMPHMQKYYNKNSENVEVLAVNWTSKEKNDLTIIEEFVETYELTFPIPLDDKDKVTEAYRIIGVPVTYMIHTDGTTGSVIKKPIDEKMINKLVKDLH